MKRESRDQKEKFDFKGADQGFLIYYSCPTVENSRPLRSKASVFSLIHFILHLNREQNPYVSRYFIQEFVTDLI